MKSWKETAQQLSYWHLLSSPRLASIPLYSNIPISPSVPISRYPGEYFDIKKMKWRGLLRVSTWLCFRTCRKDYSNSMKINAQAYSAVSNVSHDNWFWHRGKKKPAMRRKQFYYDRSTLHSPYDSNAWDEKEKSLCWVGERRWSVCCGISKYHRFPEITSKKYSTVCVTRVFQLGIG